MMRLATVGGSPVCRGPYRHSPKSPEVSPNQGHGVGGPAVEVFTFPVGRAVTYKPRVYPGRGGPAELVQNFTGRLPLRRVGGLVGHQVSLIVPKEGGVREVHLRSPDCRAMEGMVLWEERNGCRSELEPENEGSEVR